MCLLISVSAQVDSKLGYVTEMSPMKQSSMDTDQATRVMIHVHQKGVGVCGIFTYEVAETKVTQVMDFARKHQHPLQCTMERE